MAATNGGSMITQLYADDIARQADDNPTIYGDVDFALLPERYDRDASVDDERFAPIRSRVADVIDRGSVTFIVHCCFRLRNRAPRADLPG